MPLEQEISASTTSLHRQLALARRRSFLSPSMARPSRRRRVAGRRDRPHASGSCKPGASTPEQVKNSAHPVRGQLPGRPDLELLSDTYGQGQFGGDKVYVVQSATKVIERCLLMCTDPGDLVLDPTCGSGTTAYVGRAVGTPLDHHRHLPRRTGAGPTAADGRKVSLLPARRLRKGRAKEGELAGTPPAPTPTRGDIRHGLRQRARPAHHLEVDRQQPRHQGGHDPRARSMLRSSAMPTSRRCTTDPTRTSRPSASPGLSRSSR